METTKADVSKCKETCVFIFLVLMVQVLGITSIVLVAFWLGHFRNGFGWKVDPEHKFNFHPVFMVSSFIYLYSDGKILVQTFIESQLTRIIQLLSSVYFLLIRLGHKVTYQN